MVKPSQNYNLVNYAMCLDFWCWNLSEKIPVDWRKICVVSIIKNCKKQCLKEADWAQSVLQMVPN